MRVLLFTGMSIGYSKPGEKLTWVDVRIYRAAENPSKILKEEVIWTV